jgi:hypothetical protein
VSFSAIISSDKVSEANLSLEAAGFGPENFSVPLWKDDELAAHSYGLNSGNNAAFEAAIEALGDVSIRKAAPGTVEFNEHVASLGLKREPTYVPEPFEAPS